jgi:hypothetical protein
MKIQNSDSVHSCFEEEVFHFCAFYLFILLESVRFCWQKKRSWRPFAFSFFHPGVCGAGGISEETVWVAKKKLGDGIGELLLRKSTNQGRLWLLFISAFSWASLSSSSVVCLSPAPVSNIYHTYYIHTAYIDSMRERESSMHVGWMDECVFNGDERRRRLYIYEVDSLHVSFGSSPPFCLCVCVRARVFMPFLFFSHLPTQTVSEGRQKRRLTRA